MAGVKCESYFKKYVLRRRLKTGRESMRKSDVRLRGYVVPNVRCKVTEPHLGKLSKKSWLLQKILIS